METRVIKLADIKPAPYNPRVQLTTKDQEYKALDASIEENGLVLPLIVNIRDNCLIGGHQRLSVLLAAGETETNAVVVDMPEAQAKALCIALNKLDGEWDYGQLADIIQQLIDDGENLLATGFTQADIISTHAPAGGATAIFHKSVMRFCGKLPKDDTVLCLASFGFPGRDPKAVYLAWISCANLPQKCVREGLALKDQGTSCFHEGLASHAFDPVLV